MDYLGKYSFLEAFGVSRASRETHGLVENRVGWIGARLRITPPSRTELHLLEACFIPIRCLFDHKTCVISRPAFSKALLTQLLTASAWALAGLSGCLAIVQRDCSCCSKATACVGMLREVQLLLLSLNQQKMIQ